MRSLVLFVIFSVFCSVIKASGPTTYLRPLPDPMDPRFRSHVPEPIVDTPSVPSRPSGFGIPCYGNRCSGHNIKCCPVHGPNGTTGRCINPQFERC